MSRWVLRVLAVLLAALFAVPATDASALAAAPQPVSFAYNDAHHTSVGTTTHVERGPPAASDRAVTHGAGDRWSHGASACSGSAASSAAATYDDTARLEQVALATSTTREHVFGDGGALTSLAWSDVAANSGTKIDSWLAKRGLVRDERGSIGPFGSSSSRLTNSQAADMANRLGFRATNLRSRGQTIFTDGKRCITQDIDSHPGGLWKMARTPEGLASKSTRSGTYDYDLNYIGP